ncbi:unnamed protein product [Prorocentrum cordatum]|uniref:Uncharacterized protein n=1 Tax=Prorocentrum cordatum TaxID=2364126 RepID=A0ABN9XBM5_9DINO|nr:unnamed protein product [Polarella glacialis]
MSWWGCAKRLDLEDGFSERVHFSLYCTAVYDSHPQDLSTAWLHVQFETNYVITSKKKQCTGCTSNLRQIMGSVLEKHQYTGDSTREILLWRTKDRGQRMELWS